MSDEKVIYVQPVDPTTGKSVRVVQQQTLIDGVPRLVDQEVVVVADRNGKLAEVGDTSQRAILRELRAMRKLLKERARDPSSRGYITDKMALKVDPSEARKELKVVDTLSAAGDRIILALEGRPYCGVSLNNANVMNAKIMILHSTDDGATWDERFFFNGDNWVAIDELPHPVEPIRTYSLAANPSDTHIMVFCLTYVSGGTTVTIRANDIADPVSASLNLPFMGPTGTLGAAGQVVEMTCFRGATGFFIDANNFVGTLQVEASPFSHGDTTWASLVFFASDAWHLTWVVSSPAAGLISVPITAGIQRIRLRASAYTSGSVTVHSRTMAIFDALATLALGQSGQPAPFFYQASAAVDGANLMALQARATAPIATAEALVTRPLHRGLSLNQYFFLLPSQVHVAVANTVHWDLFNADATLLVRVLSILQIPDITTAVTGIVFDWLLERTTAVGTGGTALTAWLSDLSGTALDADITCRSKPTGGATASTDLRNYSLSSEETNAATIQIASQGGLELVPEPLRPINGGQGIVLRGTAQGIRCVQITNSAAGNTGWLIGFSVE